MKIHDLRKEYGAHSLKRKDLHHNPFEQFKAWLEEAISREVIEPTAFQLATSTTKGLPSCRTVLLKHFDEQGFIYFTNLESRKSREIHENPRAFGVWWWKELERQAMIEGNVEQTSREEAAEYFAKRPRGSQLGTWSSRQDAVISSREILESEYKRLDEKFANTPLPLPPFWGGFKITPVRFEFWQGRLNRMHDRFCYTPEGTGWRIDRLSP